MWIELGQNNSKKQNNMGAWIPAAASAVGGALGFIGQNKRAEKQHERQKELMGIQQKNQQQLNQQGSDLQYDMWNKTNYGAQLKHMEDAGLNVGMMYQGGGASGTTGSQGGGSAASGSAAAPMDIQAAMNAATQAAQLGLLGAQKKNIEADTHNKKMSGNNQYEDSIGKGYLNKITAAGLDDRVQAEGTKAYLDKHKAEGDANVNLGSNEDAPEWMGGKKLNRYEQAEMEKLKGVRIDNLVKMAQEGLSKATASNLLSNDEMIGLQTDILRAQTGIINSEAFKKLPMELQATLLMVVRKFGGM